MYICEIKWLDSEKAATDTLKNNVKRVKQQADQAKARLKVT